MSTRQKTCSRCGAAIVYAAAPNGGRIPLDSYPDDTGRIRVDVLGRDLIALRPGQPTSDRTKTYDRHQCGPRDPQPRPELRPTQLPLGGEA